ncbi:hypothetical protein [Legionella fallonii]|uniref:Neurogenic locus notch like protein n=1 Tax=Legionella fallonii LLAP-10 TaxID=1212491 RepID=A0A098G1H2_9GAMM|nr:hypothetical protein [Legionella fallonii]CEG56317.1 conserved exported protein of unknown function [Legionella fallonii LLAP-10]
MRSFKPLFLASVLNLITSPLLFAETCCNKMGGVNYCDSSAGRLVCNNGFYSACYCTPHAVMDLQLLKGCCLWHGGVLPTYDTSGLVVCNDGSISEECTLGTPEEKVAAW